MTRGASWTPTREEGAPCATLRLRPHLQCCDEALLRPSGVRSSTCGCHVSLFVCVSWARRALTPRCDLISIVLLRYACIALVCLSGRQSDFLHSAGVYVRVHAWGE